MLSKAETETSVRPSLLVLKRIQTNGFDTAEREAAEKEVDILKGLRFPNVVGYADSFSEGDAGASLCVVMEYAEEGTLVEGLLSFYPGGATLHRQL